MPEALSQPCAVVVMGKLPVPGRVKTRLRLAPIVSALLYRAMLEDVFALVEQALKGLGGGQAIFACALQGGETLAEAERLAPHGWRVVEQSGEELGQRMRHAWRVGHFDPAGEPRRTVVMGSDLPAFPPERIHRALDALSTPGLRAVFVPATDGGYVLLGMTQEFPALFASMRWSTATVMAETRDRAAATNIELVELPPHPDVDEPDDLTRLIPTLSPDSATARAMKRLGLIPNPS